MRNGAGKKGEHFPSPKTPKEDIFWLRRETRLEGKICSPYNRFVSRIMKDEEEPAEANGKSISDRRRSVCRGGDERTRREIQVNKGKKIDLLSGLCLQLPTRFTINISF